MWNKKWLGSTEVIGGMGLLLLGHKMKALAMFGHGLSCLEQAWRDAHPDVASGWSARWEQAIAFYEATHQNETNRTLHRWGIPIILTGAVGLLLAHPFRKPWWLSAAAFAGGWTLNIIGHSLYEKNAPAFTEDPLSFVAGPVWDIQQTLGRFNAKTPPLIEERVTVEVDHG